MEEDHYIRLRSKYLPLHSLLIFIAESPPASGKYFYDPAGQITEPLFKALIQDVLNVRVQRKDEGLKSFQEAGYLLLDATYFAVNKGLTDNQRTEAILAGVPRLVRELETLSPDKSTPIVLIKANICRLLEPILKLNGFCVKNSGVVVPFPSTGQQGRFRDAIRQILK